MYRFNCDYLEGAHENIIKRLTETNLSQTPGYGADEICFSAKEKIRSACHCPDAAVYFLVGGTQANYTVLDSILRGYEGVLAADTGHVSVHEAGAIEYSGHKVITIPAVNGKVDPSAAEYYMASFYADATNTHMVRPGAIYISHPSEYGTLYTEEEIRRLRGVCDRYGMRLFLDGARLAYGLAAEDSDVTLPVIARYCDAFYIGGTKCGALFGEAVVFPDPSISPCFFTEIKQHGALLAKGRMLGIQFDELFSDGLYESIAAHAVSLAIHLRGAMIEKGYEPYNDSPTNQQFFIMNDEKLEELSDKVVLDNWGPMGEGNSLVRITTSWATPPEAVEYLISLL
ncbi:MAG: low specificity L-threonine aldolase [Clostridia bacterium]|nr:low specificity L-threonine aldolase [Clostridia bacterium]